MRFIVGSLIAALMVAIAVPAFAQEIIVTAQRRGVNNNDGSYSEGVIASQRPVIALKRRADYVVQTVRLTNDTRDADMRKTELTTTLRTMIGSAPGAGMELAIGDYVVEPLTTTNLARLVFQSDGRPDTSTTTFLVKVRLAPDMTLATAQAQINRYVGAVAKAGRSSLVTTGEPTLSVVNPDQYRGAIADLIAADAAVMAAKFGTAYGVEVSGLDRPVEWARAGTLEVFLYLPSAYKVTRR